ncbi:MAG: hypothetical protein GTO17_12015 [Candidatus Aminicenantes bacterium]|nr:hypothetical protein [Candidatus Aminicenantes bacterium]
MRFIKITLITVLLFFSISFVYADTNLYLFGKGNFVMDSGSEDDYRPGENDFPMASSFNNFGFGLGVVFESKKVFYGLEAHYTLSGNTTLTDPSDNDTVEVDTYKHISGLIALGFNLVYKPNLRLFINGGGGVSLVLDAEMKTYTSQLGYETQIEAPNKYPLTVFGGVGAVINFSQSLGLWINGRYQYLAIDVPESAVVVLVGLVFGF